MEKTNKKKNSGLQDPKSNVKVKYDTLTWLTSKYHLFSCIFGESHQNNTVEIYKHIIRQHKDRSDIFTNKWIDKIA